MTQTTAIALFVLVVGFIALPQNRIVSAHPSLGSLGQEEGRARDTTPRNGVKPGDAPS